MTLGEYFISDLACGGKLEPGDVLSSPNYPEYYGQLKHCRWTVSLPDGQFVVLRVLHFNLLPENVSGCSD